MKMTYGSQQGDVWLRNRVGRITGSRIADVCSYLSRKSGDKQAGDPSGARDEYLNEIITERLTGKAKDHYNSPAMQRGTNLEDDARLYYESVLRVMCEPVNFVLHSKYDFTGASPDSLVGAEGILEIKCLLPWNHMKYIRSKQIPEEYLPQVAWELACTGRKWVDFVLFCPDILSEKRRFFYRRIDRQELEWTVGFGKDELGLVGESVIDYLTSEVLKFNREVEDDLASDGSKPIAPFPVQVLEEAAEDSLSDVYLTDEELAVLDRGTR